MNHVELSQKLANIVALIEGKEDYFQERLNDSPENTTLTLAHSVISLIKTNVRSLHEEIKTTRSPLSNVMGVDEASELWGLSPGYIKNLCAENKITARKIGNTWIIDKERPNLRSPTEK